MTRNTKAPSGYPIYRTAIVHRQLTWTHHCGQQDPVQQDQGYVERPCPSRVDPLDVLVYRDIRRSRMNAARDPV